MARLLPAVHRTILVVDVEGFGDRRRTNPHQVVVRKGLNRGLRTAFSRADIPWADCHHEDRGDGVIVLAPSDVPKCRFVEQLPHQLALALLEHNTAHSVVERIRLRMAVHAGEIIYDEYGATGASINLAFRLLEAGPLKAALADSPGVLALIASSWFFDEVVRHSTVVDPTTYRPVRVAIKETSAVGWICLPDHPYPPGTPAAPPEEAMSVVVPRQLPLATRHFAGRAAEVAELTSLLDHTAERGGMVVVSAIDGTAGIGKTALAVHWAHQVADRFPDGQLYVNLLGFDPSGSTMTPAEAVRGFLDAFEVPPERIPVHLDAQAALYRSLLAGRRVLILLDNARDVDQVRPLLPGSPGCLVVVTSRNRLISLIASEGAHPLTLDLLTPAEARELLVRRLGHGRVAAEPRAAQQITVSCARLPLALSIVAARAATHARFPLTALADELREARSGLDAFDGGDIAANLRAVFSWSYERLRPPAARLFRLLGLHPGPDVTPSAAASLAGIPTRHVRPMLAELAQANQVAERTPGRFTFHDLQRAYATEQAHATDSEAERSAAVHRLLDHYLHTAHNAILVMYPRWQPITPPPPLNGVAPEKLADHRGALAWFEAEHPVLLAAIQLAAATGHDTHAWRLPCTLQEFFERRGHWHDWIATQHTALDAARRNADLYGRAHVHRSLGRAYPWLDRHDEARAHLRLALDLFEELDDQIGQADTHIDLGWMFEHQNRHREALTHAAQGLALSRTANYPCGQAKALNNIGWYHALLGDHQVALTHCGEALALCHELGDRRAECHTLDSLGYAHHHLGNHRQAIAYYQQSLVLKRELGNRYNEATTLAHLGDTYHASGDLETAHDNWYRALHIIDNLGPVISASLGNPDADQILAKLRHVDST